ncbi:MAG: 30S ribosomal protein S18 [Dehalococcoidia bacterium]|nr:30S ribosomal protein S18 [Dehalococcoidia bacterium]
MTTNRQNSKRNSFSYDFRARKKPISKMIKGLPVDYKDVDVLLSYVSDRAKISSAYRVGNDAKDHRSLTTAIKRARHMALLPISHEHELVRNFIQDSEEVKSEDSEEVKSEDSEEVKSEDSEEVKPENSDDDSSSKN